MTIDGSNYGVFIENNPNERAASFNKDMKERSVRGHVISCSLLIDLPVGIADGNHSYGGYCELIDDQGRKQAVEICNDDLVGHFKLDFPSITAQWSESDLAKFVAKNCFGG